MDKCLKIFLLRGLVGCALALASASALFSQSKSQDGPVSVAYGSLYETGSIKIEPYDLTTLPNLPAGYAALNNKAYLITTTAVVGPPHVIHFSAASITDEEVFRNLRIFHAEPDTFDPDSPMWVDATVRSPEEPAPDFKAKTINAGSDRLGVFVIGMLVQKIPPNTKVADLAVTCSGSAERVIAPNNITYTCTVMNKGPQPASEIGLVDSLPNDGVLISAKPSQGSCKERTGSLYCKLGALTVGASATIVLVIKPNEGTASFPPEGKMTANSAWAAASEMDSNADNNNASETTLILPDPNMPPSITIDHPKTGALFVGPADITIKATAFDSDGTVAKVEFLDNGELIASGIPSVENRLTITERNVSFGFHSIIAVVTDNGGRQNISNAANIIVNGQATVKIVKPGEGSLIAPGSDVTITAQASHPSGLINRVDFFANSLSLGEGVLVGPNRYELRVKKIAGGLYSIIAVAIDGSGISTTTAPVNVTVTRPPTVSIVNPSEGATFPSLDNINITAKASDPDGSIKKVDFYANGLLIGSASDVGTDQFMMTWRRLQDGVHSLTTIATDELGVTSKSDPVKIKVGNPSTKP
jgi:uncharacterized repeat protein (TIGR01451 family)